MQDCECNLQKKRNKNVFKMKFLMHKLLRENFGWDGCKTSHSKRHAMRKTRTVSAKRFWHPVALGIMGLTSTGTGYNIMRGNRISFHSVAVKCLIAWSALLIGNTVQIRNSHAAVRRTKARLPLGNPWEGRQVGGSQVRIPTATPDGQNPFGEKGYLTKRTLCGDSISLPFLPL